MHFYTETENGIEPRHFVEMAKDKTRRRPSRTTDAKKAFKEKGERWAASVTTVLNILDKPALVNWKVGKHLETVYAIDVSQVDFSDYSSFERTIKAKTQEEMDKAPKAGTDIHQILEDNLFIGARQTHLTPMENKIVDNVENMIRDKTGLDSRDDWYFEKYFLSDDGYAGCADLVSKNFTWLIDYKSKQHTVQFKPGKMAYPDHTRQLGAYMRGFNATTSTMESANLFVCLEDAQCDFHTHDADKLENGYLDFMDCLSIYKRNSYDMTALED